MRAVPHTAELDRVLAVSRRDQLYNIPAVNIYYNDPRLRPIQRATLYDLHSHLYGAPAGLQGRGLLAPIAVGAGKAWICCLAGLAVPHCKTLVWLVPANLLVQSRHVAEQLTRDWQLPYTIRCISYEQLSSAKHYDVLERTAPDVICCDEAHKLRGGSVRTKRFRRYLKTQLDAEHAGGPRAPVVLFLSGTITQRSLHDFAWMLYYTHAPANTPIPRSYPVLDDWDRCLGVARPGYKLPLAAGALTKLCLEGETPRQGFRRRLVETLGVVATSESAVDMSLNIQCIERPPTADNRLPPAVQAALDTVRKQHKTPAGVTFEDEQSEARYLRQLALGYWLAFDKPMPQAWLDARANWHAELGAILRKAAPGQDSPLLVVRAIQRGDIVAQYYAPWRAAQEQYGDARVSQPQWIDQFAVRAVLAHAQRERKFPGVVWYKSIAFGDALRDAGMPVFGAGADKALLEEASRANRWIACSIPAHGTGKNLQRYSTALVVSPPSSGQVWEQLLGRHHRPGQLADEVNVHVWQYTAEQRAALAAAQADAEYLESMQGPQKLRLATYTTV